MRGLTLLRDSLLSLTLLTFAVNAQTLSSHRDLEWQAPYRWVHIDNVDVQKIQLFEGARKGWLANLQRGDTLLGDGRPLFWCAHAKIARTYFTFYPFRTWTELDTRGKMIKQTQALVGDSAVKTYDAGDEALVPPHGSQIWRRSVESDIVWSGSDSLTDVTAAVGRMEIHQIDWYHWDEFEKLWKELQETLTAARYPLACRVYTNVYTGTQGECMLLWLARDSVQYHGAASLQTALAEQLGEDKAAGLLAKLGEYFPLKQSYEMERRTDLSNLGR